MNYQSNELVRLERYLVNPTEDLDIEYKGWLDLRKNPDRANLAKAVIALANHGGGVIVLGFEDRSTGLAATPKPAEIPDVTQDDVNAAVSRYAEPQLHCRLYLVKHPVVGSVHPMIRVPGGNVPVMSKRDEPEGSLRQHRIYVRRPGPNSEEPQTADEWRTLLDRCVRARREDMLDSIRGIVLGRVDESGSGHVADGLQGFMDSSRERWMALVQNEPKDATMRFPNGHYEFTIAPVDPRPADNLSELKDRLEVAQRVKTSGWPPFLDIGVQGLNSYVSEYCIEAWLGRPMPGNRYEDTPYADFWRASLLGQLYIIRGYAEDSVEGTSKLRRKPGEILTMDISVIRIWECLRIAGHFLGTFEDVEEIRVRCRYSGLQGRLLIDSSSPAFSIRRGVSQVDEVPLVGQFTLQQLENNMPEVLRHLMAPLFEHFEFFRLTVDQVQSIIDRYRKSWPEYN